jgi:hypothetical protein
MIAGHFGLAAGVKGRQRQVPLWALMLATVWLDIVFAPLLAAGVESIDNVPGTTGGYGKAIIHADWTHSLVGALVLAALFGLVATRPWGRRGGHRARGGGALPLAPGSGGAPRRHADPARQRRRPTPAWLRPVEGPGGVDPGRAGPGRRGAWLYWRAAVQTSPTDARRANLLGLLVLGAGVVTLAVDALVA